MPSNESRSRGYCFTINNPSEFDEVDIERITSRSKAGIIGTETGENGTRHYQGFVRFEHPVTFSRVKQMLPRAHIELQKGTTKQAWDYCAKDGDFRTWGEAPEEKRNNKERFQYIIQCAEQGDLESIKRDYPGDFLRYYDRLRGLKHREPRILDTLCNEWWVGPTGTGKSKNVWNLYPIHYNKLLNKWWDGYEDEDVVVIEEWSPKNEMSASNLKIWADRYPFNAEFKGGMLRNIRPQKLIVTSNYTMEQCFERVEDLEPLKRRFKVVHFEHSLFNLDSIFNDY